MFYAALGTSAYIIGADRIAQALYDFAQKISHLRFGWMILVGILGLHPIHYLCMPVDQRLLRSFRVLPACYGLHDHYNPMRLCLWHERVLCRRGWDPSWISCRVYCAPFAL